MNPAGEMQTSAAVSQKINTASSTNTAAERSPAGSGAPGKFVLLIGPSGVGKSVMLKKLRADHPNLRFPRSATTRARRPGEGDELYHFVSDAEFDALLGGKKLLEWAVVHGGARYGTMIDEIVPFIQQGHIVVREVDVQGFDSIRKHHLFEGKDAPYRLQSIFLLPESQEQLIAHIQKRAPMTPDELAKRMESMKLELDFAKLCDHSVVNREGLMDQAYTEIETLIFS